MVPGNSLQLQKIKKTDNSANTEAKGKIRPGLESLEFFFKLYVLINVEQEPQPSSDNQAG